MKKKVDLATYRLNNWKDLDNYLQGSEKNEFHTFLNKAYKLLMDLHPGEQIVLEDDVDPENREKFIKVSCLFISENHPDYEFTDDYCVIRRLTENPEDRVKQIMIQITQKKKLNNELERTPGADRSTAQRKKDNC